MSEAFINAISEGHKDEVIKWLQKIYSENEQLRHDITRHVQICAEQANEIAELRAWKEGKRGVEEYFALKGENAELRKQLEQAEALLLELAQITCLSTPQQIERFAFELSDRAKALFVTSPASTTATAPTTSKPE